MPDVWTSLLAGAGVGFLITVLGGGGSLLLVPILIYFFGRELSEAVGTSLSVICASALIGFIGHFRQKRVDLKMTLGFGSAAMLGAVLGARLHGVASERATLLLYAAVLIFAGARMLIGHPKSRERAKPKWALLLALGVFVGVLSGFLGVGGGAFFVPVLVFGAGVPIYEAIGTSVGVIALSSASGAIAHIVEGTIDVQLALTTGFGAAVGALVGVPISGRIPERPLRVGFAIVVGLAAVYIVVNVLSMNGGN